MIDNKVILEGTIVSLLDWHELRNGGQVRDIYLEAEGQRINYYCLTEVVQKDQKAKDLAKGDFCRIEGYVNGILIESKHGPIHGNKIVIAKLWKPG